MIINFNEQELQEFPNFKGGEKSLNAKMFFDGMNRIIYGELEPGASIGMHRMRQTARSSTSSRAKVS